MNATHLAVFALRAALLLALSLAAVRLLGRAPAALRRLVLVAGLVAALVVPALSAATPASWRIGAGHALPRLGMPVAEALAPQDAAAVGVPVVSRSATGAPAPTPFPWHTAIVALWAAGALLVGARLTYGVARAWAIARRASPVDASLWGGAVAEAERLTGLRARVRESDEVDAPAVTGIALPVVLVPRAARTWSDARRRLVLLHELAHVRHMDCLAQVVAQLVCALHWFDPLAWLALRRLRLEREVAADDAVLAAGVRPSSYAQELLAIAGAGGSGREVPSGALGMARPSELAARVIAVVAPGRTRARVSRAKRVLVVALSTAAALAVACASPDRDDAQPAISSGGQGVASEARASATSSTLRPALQAIADDEIGRLQREWAPEAATIVVLDPATGEILANAGRAGGAQADVAVQRAFPPGSTLKGLIVAAALDERVVSASERFDCRPRSWGDRSLSDASANPALDVGEILAVSSNVGTSRIFDRLGGERLGAWLRRFHLGEPPAAAGEGAAAGQLPARIDDSSFEGAVVAMGARIAASPVQMAAAYAAIANQGVYLTPTIIRRADAASAGQRVMSPDTARVVLGMLEGAVGAERATGKAARIEGVRVAGKTGTAELSTPGGAAASYASFVGIVPADSPRFVVLVGAEVTREGATGGKLAAPVFARVASRALASE